MKEADVQKLGEQLLRKSWRLALAESCTGGLISAACTNIAGSSRWFECGFVTYSNEAKIQMLGVDASIIDTNGAVSQATVLAMATGALRHSEANIALSVSGIAGPDGGTMEKPVGTVWFAIATTLGDKKFFQQQFSGDRQSVREQAVQFAIEQLVLATK